MIWLLPSNTHIRCQRTDLHQRQPVRLQQVRCLAHITGEMTMWKHQLIMLEIHEAKTCNSGNPQINFIHHHPAIVNHLGSHHLQVFPRSTTRPHSTSQHAHNHALVQPKDIEVMDHRGKPMISPKEDMLHLKYFPLSNSHEMGRHLQAHVKCLQHSLETMQLLSGYLPPPLP